MIPEALPEAMPEAGREVGHSAVVCHPDHSLAPRPAVSRCLQRLSQRSGRSTRRVDLQPAPGPEEHEHSDRRFSTLLHSRLRGHPAVPGVDPALRGQRGPRPAHRGRAAARRAEDPRRWRTSGLFPSRTTGPAFAFARYFTGENRDLMALDQARGVVLERLRRSRSPARERVRQCSRRLGLEVRQNVPLGSRRHPSWASRRAGHLVRVAHRRVAHRPRDPAGGPEGTGAPLPITRFA